MSTTHNYQILMALKAGATLSSFDGLKQFGTMRMAARIGDLRTGKHDGVRHVIDTVMARNADGRGRHALYRMSPSSGKGITVTSANVGESSNAIPKAENQPTLFP